MSRVETVTIELAVELGSATMPVHQLLRMGRGAVIALDSLETDQLVLLANNTPVAEGQIVVEGEKISLAITRMLALEDR
jgi:flagellar motor switch protein FliN